MSYKVILILASSVFGCSVSILACFFLGFERATIEAAALMFGAFVFGD